MSRPVTPSRAFTILEMVIVLTLLGLVVGVTAPRFIGGSAQAQARTAARGLIDALTAQRAEAIRSMAPARLYLVGGGPESGLLRLIEPGQGEPTAEALMAMLTEQGRVVEPFRILGVWNGADLAISDRPGEAPAAARSGAWRVRTILFEPTGRARIDGGEGGGETGLALVARQGGDTIWRIEFDPISGVPGVRTE